MLIKENIEKTGVKLEQISFLVDNSLGEVPLLLYTPKKESVQLSDFSPKWRLFAPIIFSYIKYANNLLHDIYESHKLLLEEDIDIEKKINDITNDIKEAQTNINYSKLKEIQEEINNIKEIAEKRKNKKNEILLYPIRIQDFIGILQKILLLFVFSREGIYLLKNNNKNPLREKIKNLDDFLSKKFSTDESEIYRTIIPTENKTEELFKLITNLNKIFQSQYLIGACNFSVTPLPIVSAIDAKNETECFFHQHKIQQIILAFNNFLKEVGFFK